MLTQRQVRFGLQHHFDNRNFAHTRRRVVTAAEEGEAAEDPMGPVVVWRDCYGKSGSDRRHPDERRIRS